MCESRSAQPWELCAFAPCWPRADSGSPEGSQRLDERRSHGPSPTGTTSSLAIGFHFKDVSLWWPSGQYLGEASSYEGEVDDLLDDGHNYRGHEQVPLDRRVADNIVEAYDHNLLLEPEIILTYYAAIEPANVLQPYCNRADTRWYATDTRLAPAHRKPPK